MVSTLTKEFNQCKSLRVTADNLPNSIGRLQCLFLESPAFLLLAIKDISLSLDRYSSGTDNEKFLSFVGKKKQLIFEKLKHSRYGKATTRQAARPLKPRVAELTELEENMLRTQVVNFNIALENKLYKKCLIKTFRKNFKAQSVKRVWSCRDGRASTVPLNLFTLRDRVLQTLVLFCIEPIVKAQADILSFAYKKNRKALDAVSYIYRSLAADQLGRSSCRVIDLGKHANPPKR